MGSLTRRPVLIALVAAFVACGTPSQDVLEDSPIDLEIALEEAAAYQLGLEPPIEVVAYLASMCACGDFVLLDLSGNELRVRWGTEMWSGYPPGFTIKGQESEEKSTSWAAQHTLGVWFKRNCSLEQEALRYPSNLSQISPDSSDYLCPLLFNIAINSDACYLLESMVKPKGQNWT